MFGIDKDGFPEKEARIRKFWREAKIFQRSMERRKGEKRFVIYDGPPFATGLPHYGHLLAGTIKDVIPRYKTMKGYYVPRRFGWDCHGLPVENEIEKGQQLSGSKAIEAFGIAQFNEECRSIVLRYTEEWKETVERLGRFVDFSNPYRTMDVSFMESVWWVFKALWNKGLVYQGVKVMPFSAKLGTPLSNFEANLNYKEINDPSIVVAFPLSEEKEVSLLVWTTTPWTLPSNLGVIVHPDVVYCKVRAQGKWFILARDRVSAYFNEDCAIEEVFVGRALEGKRYQPLFDTFTDHPAKRAFTVLVDEFVSAKDGTGIVHAAPAFGESDFFVCKREGIDPVCPVDQNGQFTEVIPALQGKFVKDADKEIIRDIKQQGRLFRRDTIRHRYPFCWRSDTPLIYKAVSTWFVAVEKIKDRLIEANQQIDWVPKHIQNGRFGKWLEDVRDWAISRNRYWGTPIPIWVSEEGDCHVVGSLEELEQLCGKKVEDLHRHHIDSLTFSIKGKTYRRITEVFDCWFESGSMPYAQNHYPFEGKEQLQLPADFVAEGLDQTRGWFYTLNVLSVALFDKPAFFHCIVNGIILAEDGEKMSKRLRNYPDPKEIFDKYGADSVRLYLLNSPVVHGNDFCFSEKGVAVVLRQFLLPFWNAYVFFATYAQIYQWQPPEHFCIPNGEIDKWILSCLQKLIVDVESGLDKYQLQQAVGVFVGFIDQLTNWYIRRSRSRFWADEDTPDRQQAFATLYRVLHTLSRLAAPFIPFLSEVIYQELRQKQSVESVHLCDFPRAKAALRDTEIEQTMTLVQKSVNIGHGLRKEHQLKVRQPLSSVYIISPSAKVLVRLQTQKALIMEELNVKDLVLLNEKEVGVTYHIKPNYRVLGKRIGPLMKQVQTCLASLSETEKKQAAENGQLELTLQGESLLLGKEDLVIEKQMHLEKKGFVSISKNNFTIMLDTNMTEELQQEAIARELVNKLNTMRREAKLEVTDRIVATLATKCPIIKAAFHRYQRYILDETLTVDLHFVEESQGTLWDINGRVCSVKIDKVAL